MGPIGNFMIKSLFFSAILIGISLFTFDITTRHGMPIMNISTDLYTQQLINQSQNITTKVLNQSITGVPYADSGLFLLLGGFDIVKNTFSMTSNFLLGIITTYQQTLHIPTWFANIILAAFSIFIGWTIIGLVLGKEV